MSLTSSKLFIRIGILCLIVLFCQYRCFAQTAKDGIGLTDSHFLLRNILKDIRKEKELKEQYVLFLRAELLYTQIKESLPVSEVKDLRKQLSIAFRHLPPPALVFADNGLRFTLRDGKSDQFYWSDPVPESMFVEYLNDIKVPPDVLSKQLSPNSHTIIFNPDLSEYNSQRPSGPMRGVNGLIIREFADWLSKKRKRRFMLPTEDMVLASKESHPSCWTSTVWEEKDSVRRDAWEMFGADFYTFFIRGERSGELPEACYAEMQICLVITSATGKRMHLKALRSRT